MVSMRTGVFALVIVFSGNRVADMLVNQLEKKMDFGKKVVFAFCVGSVCSIVQAASWCSEGEASVTMEKPEVTVTANKIEEDVQDVSQSITVVGEDILEEKGIENVPDLIREIPNAFYSPSQGNSQRCAHRYSR